MVKRVIRLKKGPKKLTLVKKVRPIRPGKKKYV